MAEETIMNLKIVSAGHICVDITPMFSKGKTYERIDELLSPGKLINTEGVSVSTGGSVANTGLALKKLGMDVVLQGKIGRDYLGEIVRKLVSSHGAKGLIESAHDRTSYSVIINVPGIDRIILHDPGANHTFTSADVSNDVLSDAAILHFGYPVLMQKMMDPEEMKRLFLRARAAGAATSLDMAMADPASEAGKVDWKMFLEDVLPLVDFFVPSFEEICMLLDRPRWERLSGNGGSITDCLDMEKEAMPLARQIMQMGCGSLLLKCGTSGIILLTAGEERLGEVGKNLRLPISQWADYNMIQPCYPIKKVCSATGAGDVSIAAFLSAVCRHKTPKRCLQLAAAEGACSVRFYDPLSGIVSLDELESIIDNGWNLEG